MNPLPIEHALPDIASALAHGEAFVLVAPPGAGKTTRVPRFIAERTQGNVLVSEPRRLAAKLAAKRVAQEMGERVGEQVGYSVRFEDVSSTRTRLWYLTDGVLLRRLVRDPELVGVGAVVLDEFHERRLNGDVCLALLGRLRKQRPGLCLVLMSATLDGEAIAKQLGWRLVQSEGRAFPVLIEHQRATDDRPLEKQVATATREALKRTAGDVLVFLPGAAEIRKAQAHLTDLARQQDLLIAPLHGDLPLEDQSRAVQQAARRKVVLSTNVAESSVTIENVTAVVDSGTARIAAHDPWTGLDRLVLHKVSRASATQRAGRAGRTREGLVLRLYTQGDLAHRPQADTPEVARLDLGQALLDLHGAGVSDLGSLEWLTPPQKAALASAETLLRDLGAIDHGGELTEIGRAMLRLPVHPRLARVVVSGIGRGLGKHCCLMVALVSARDFRLELRNPSGPAGRVDSSGDCDVLELMDQYRIAEEAGFERGDLRRLGFDANVLGQVRRTARQLAAAIGGEQATVDQTAPVGEQLRLCLLSGFIDRLAQRKNQGDELVFANGASGVLARESVVLSAKLLLAIRAERREQGRDRRTIVRLASRIDPEWLLDAYPERLVDSEELVFNDKAGRVERVSRIRFEKLTLEESRAPAPASPEAGRLLLQAAEARGPRSFDPDGAFNELCCRLALLDSHHPEGASATSLNTDELLVRATSDLTSLAALAERGLAAAAWEHLPLRVRDRLERLAPRHVTLVGGRRVAIHYEPDKPPWIQSRLQDFFSMTSTLSICDGRVPLSIHLLAPNQRAVQVTTDLQNFWQTHYPKLRSQLMRRYPKHAWPEDGATARPPAPNAKRKR